MVYTTADILRRAMEIRRDGGRVIACLLVKARGSTPQAAGSLMIVDDTARLHGTIGGGCVEAEVRRRAHAMLAAGESGIMQFKLDHDYGWDDGLICGGTVELAVGPLPDDDTLQGVLRAIDDRAHTTLSITVDLDDGAGAFTIDLPPKPHLYIAGAGHIGAALARLAVDLDFEVTMFDDRPDLLSLAAPAGAHTCAGDIAQQLAAAEVGPDTYIAIITRGHRHDEMALEAVVARGARYIGMIGSRRKVKLTFDDLAARGVDRDALDAVHAPIGLDISSITVAEIALSIAAELVQVRRANRVRPVSGPVAQNTCANADVPAP